MNMKISDAESVFHHHIQYHIQQSQEDLKKERKKAYQRNKIHIKKNPNLNNPYGNNFLGNNDVNDYINNVLNSGGSFLSIALQILSLFRNNLSWQGEDMMKKMQDESNASRAAQEQSNHVDEIIAELAKKDDKATAKLPDDVIQWMRDHGVKVDGKSIDDYLASSGHAGGALDKGQMQAVKGALDVVANRASDLVSQDQLTIQKISQTFNVCVSISNSMQTMIADMNKAIAQNIH